MRRLLPTGARRAATLIARLLGVLLASLPLAATASVTWQHLSLDEALATASDTGQHVVIDVYTAWCPPCRMLDDQVFVDDAVAAALSQALTVKIDAEGPDGDAVLERYHVVGYPTVLFIAPDGTEVDRVFGYLEPAAFAEAATSWLGGASTIDALRATVAASPADLDAAAELAERLAVRGEREAAEALLDRLIAADPDNALGRHSAALYLRGKYIELRGAREYDTAVATLTALRLRFPRCNEADGALYNIGVAHARAGRASDAVDAFDLWAQLDRDDPTRWSSAAWALRRENIALTQARAWARRTLTSVPDSADAWVTLAQIELQRLRPVAATVALVRAWRLDPGHQEVEMLLVRASG